MKLERVLKEYKDAEQLKASTEAKIAELKQKREDLDQQFGEAIDRGDRDAAKKIRDEIGETDIDIEILERKSTAAKVTKEETDAAWNDYAKETEASIAKKRNEILKVRKALKKLTEDMVLEFNEALGMRDMLAGYTGRQKGEFHMIGIGLSTSGLKNVQLKCDCSEAIYLTSSGEWAFNPTGIDNLFLVNKMIMFGDHAPDLHF